jgi:RNA polymerase sigma-70 factor (ECF subfamily)
MDRAVDSRTSASLLSRLNQNPNDPTAWDDFVRRYGRKIHAWCRRWNLQDADAEDVTQNVLLTIARKMRTFTYDPTRSFRGWLRTLAHAAWCDWLEGRRRATPGPGEVRGIEQLETVEARDELVARLEEEYERELLDEAMARVRLRVEKRTWEAFHLLAFEDLSGAEAAERLDMKVPAVFVAKGRVQKMIQEEIRKLEGPP